jgi:hypothetical protein
MEVSIRGEMTVQFEVVNPATLELNKNKVNSHVITNTRNIRQRSLRFFGESGSETLLLLIWYFTSK